MVSQLLYLDQNKNRMAAVGSLLIIVPVVGLDSARRVDSSSSSHKRSLSLHSTGRKVRS